MTVRCLDHYRRTANLLIDTTTLHHLLDLQHHYEARLLEVGRLAEHVQTYQGSFTPLGHYTVRIQDDKTIRDIEVFVNKAGEITEEDSLTIFPLNED